MSDDVKALIAEANAVEEMSLQDDYAAGLIARLADALEAARQRPTVDRGQLANALGVALANAYDDDSVVTVEESVAAQLFASGILQDAVALSREVEARGLERLIERVTDDGVVQIFGGEKFVSVALLVSEARAQQVREGN